MNPTHVNPNSITVGHVLHAFTVGGEERELLNIVSYGNKSQFRHVIIALTVAGDFASGLDPERCKVIELRKQPGNDFRLPFRIAAMLRDSEADVVHARGWSTMVEAALASRMARMKGAMYAFHGKTIDELGGVCLKRRVAQGVIVRLYDRVVTLNDRMRMDLARECCLDERKIQVVQNGIDIDLFRPRSDQQALRQRYGLPIDRFIIGNVARLDPVKNHETIFKALDRLSNQNKKPFVLLVGDGQHRSFLEREIGRLGLADDVRIFGHSNRVFELLNCMDVYVQSSLYEGASHTLVEAMACGLPVIATDVGGTADLITDTQEGLLFHSGEDQVLANFVRELQQDGDRRHEMGRRARERAVNFYSVQRMVQRYESLYVELAMES